jgi:hypothetical protein
METDEQKLARLKEQYRIEKILQNYMRRWKDSPLKQTLLKSILERIRRKHD